MAITDRQIDAIIKEFADNKNSTGDEYRSLSNEDKLKFNERFNKSVDLTDLSNPKAYPFLTRIMQYGIPVDSKYLKEANQQETTRRQTEDANTVSSTSVHDTEVKSFNFDSTTSKLNTSTGGILQAARARDGYDTEANINTITSQPVSDRRARLSPKIDVFRDMITPGSILEPLIETHGLMFPYSPTIAENVDVNYETYDLAHGIQPIQAFRSGGQKTLTLETTFTAQTDIEARYCLACIHFVRSFSKMNFGDDDPNAGTPPPVLLFNAYGEAMFKNVPVVISNANFNWPNDVDYVYTNATDSAANPAYRVNNSLASGWVPSKFNITITLMVQRTPSSMRRFNLEEFRNGNLFNRGWI